MTFLPSIQLDLVQEDHLSATRAEVFSSNVEPFELVDGDTLFVRVDGGISTTITFVAAAFADIGNATLAEVVAAIRPTLLSLGGDAFVSGPSFGIRSNTYGATSQLEVTSGTALAALGIAANVYNGSGVGAYQLVVNRNPQSDEAQIPINALIEFDFLKEDGALPALNTFVVTVNDVVAYSGGSFQNGWTGSVLSGTPDNATTRFSLDAPADFESGEEVVVDVVRGSFEARWSFFAYDVTPPLIASVMAINKDQVQVTFNEPVTMESASIAGDALNPSSYVIERVTRPAATPGVVRVDPVSDSIVLLTTDFELTFGAGYMLVVSGITDEFDNVFVAPDNVAEFSGFLPPFPEGRRFLLHDFVPAFSLAEDITDELRLFLGCLQDSTNLHLHLIDRWVEILDPDLCPEPFLDAMLLDLGNPFEFDLDLVAKRKLAKILVHIYQLKGTAPGIVDVVRFFLGIEVEIQIFNGIGWKLGVDKLSTGGHVATPNPAVVGASSSAIYSFRVVTEEVLTAEQRSKITDIAVYMKGAQEHFIGIRDGAPIPLAYAYWKLGFTQIGHAKIATT